ncbi:unnamed protein product [Orchesella dallaii]|uniref:BTB domain-containing protein n=1 Tax=Orchesella dallaii TaxID=48710 RepID=A0ABP1Q3E3_9HEXA
MSGIIPPSTSEPPSPGVYPLMTPLNAQQLAQLPPLVLKYNFRSWIQKTSTEGDDSCVSEVITSGWNSIFAIDPVCGVNLEDKIFDYKVGDYMLLYRFSPIIQQRREQEHSAYYTNTTSKKRVCFVGPSLAVFMNLQGKEKKAVFVASFCKCRVCKKPWRMNRTHRAASKKTFKFELESLKPVDMNLRLIFDDQEHVAKLTFHPGVVDKFDITKDNEDNNSSFLAVAYCCSIPLDSLPIFPFKDFVNLVNSNNPHQRSPMGRGSGWEQENISIEITEIVPAFQPNALQQRQSQQQKAFKELYYNKAHADFVVVSKDGKKFHCNKAILCVRCPEFDRILTNGNFREGQDKEIKLEEDALATEALLKFIYFQVTGIEGLSFIGMVGTLKLAHLFGFIELVAVSVNSLLIKLKELEWEDLEALWELYNFVSKLDTIQIIFRLKVAIIMALRRLIQTKKNKRVRQDEEDVTASVNRAFGNYADLAKDLTLDLLRMLNHHKTH